MGGRVFFFFACNILSLLLFRSHSFSRARALSLSVTWCEPKTMAASRPLVTVQGLDGTASGQTALPAVFTVPIRPDVVLQVGRLEFDVVDDKRGSGGWILLACLFLRVLLSLRLFSSRDALCVVRGDFRREIEPVWCLQGRSLRADDGSAAAGGGSIENDVDLRRFQRRAALAALPTLCFP